MKCMIVFALLVAAVAAGETEQIVASPYAYGYGYPYAGLRFAYHTPLTYGAAPAPLAYAAAAAPLAYAAPSPLAYAAHAPFAYAAQAPLAYAAPAPITYAAAPIPTAYSVETAPKVELAYEPVEQHGYRIAY